MVWAATMVAKSGSSWFYFQRGARSLFDPDGALGGLDLYVAHPELQIGPLSLLVGAPFALLGQAGKIAAVVAMVACGVVLVVLIHGFARSVKPVTELICLLAFVPTYLVLALQVGHLDDVLALTFGTLALWAVRRNAALTTALCCAAAVDCKPWALGFAAMIFALPRDRWRVAVPVSAVAIAAAWLPFVLADPATLHAMQFQIKNSSASALRALGITDAHTPSWCRVTQLVAGVGLALLAALRKRVALVPAVVVAARLLLDPGTKGYYDVGLVLAVLVVDLLVVRVVVPWLTVLACALVVVPTHISWSVPSVAPAAGALRAVALIATLVVCVALCLRRDQSDRQTPGRARAGQRWWPGAGSNRRPTAFQAVARTS